MARDCPRYRWLGGAAAAAARATRIAARHAMVHPSRMEGGANVIIEAVTSGVPVLASRIDGNVGMLGADYAGYFRGRRRRRAGRADATLRDDAAFAAPPARRSAPRARRCSRPRAKRRAVRALRIDLLPRSPRADTIGIASGQPP